MPSQALEARVRMRYLPGNGTKAERATEIPKLPAERREWLEKELRYMPRLLDYNRHLLEELSDPELKGSRNQDGTRWDPLLSVAYDVSTETLVAKERWRWFYMYGTSFWQSGTEAREQDFHSPE